MSIACVLVVLLLCVLWAPIQRFFAVTALQNAVRRDWEITIGSSRSGNLPEYLPTFLQSLLSSVVDWQYSHTASYNGSQPAKTRNRHHVYCDRLEAPFRAQIHDVHIYDPEQFRGDELAAALARFPGLRRFTIHMDSYSNGPPTESDWKTLCNGIRAMPLLEELDLGGPGITDSAILPLAGHPSLRVITFSEGRLSRECLSVFATMPQLIHLRIEDQIGTTFAKDEVETALPGVQFESP